MFALLYLRKSSINFGFHIHFWSTLYLWEIKNLKLETGDPHGAKICNGETAEENCSWLHPIWPPPKRPDRDTPICVASRTSPKPILCTQRVLHVRNNVCKPHPWVSECCWYISRCKLWVMKPTGLRGWSKLILKLDWWRRLLIIPRL